MQVTTCLSRPARDGQNHGVADPALVFVHSPLVGPMTWRAVAARFTATGRRTVVADVSGAMAGAGPYLPAIVQRVAGAIAPLTDDVVLVGHSVAPVVPGRCVGRAAPRPAGTRRVHRRAAAALGDLLTALAPGRPHRPAGPDQR